MYLQFKKYIVLQLRLITLLKFIRITKNNENT